MKLSSLSSQADLHDSNLPAQVKIVTVVGARPNFMKAAPILRAIREHNQAAQHPRIEHVLVHTGQHYDELMSDRFFSDLSLPSPDVHLGVGSGSQATQTAEILRKFEEVLNREAPDVVVVVGDVNSTMACALATAKLPVAQGTPRPLVAHVEAGLRSFDRSMPEELNRVVTDHLADLLFVTEKSGIENLNREGIPAEKVFFVGNTMIDSLTAFLHRSDESLILEQLQLRPRRTSEDGRDGEYALLTLHRPANVDDPAAFREILEGLSDLAAQLPVIFPVHPRTRKHIDEFGLGNYFYAGLTGGSNGIRLIDPLGYIDFLCMMKNAKIVLTDSGGVQEETTCLGVPCVTLRQNTERPVTVEEGTNLVAGTSAEDIRAGIRRQILRNCAPCMPEKWDGQAARRIVPILVNHAAERAAESVEQTTNPALAI